MEKDEIFEMAERYVKLTGKSVFLTGKAGTGKTTFLKYITETVNKRFVVLAPTGVAAINAGGSTIHSFFQLPLCPYLPDVKELVTEYQIPEKFRNLRKERIKIIKTLDLLIIDEISMVRADLLDAVDMTLRRYRRNSKPFGGVQLLMIGDAQQLSPVVRENEWQYMSQVYESPYFFHSKALRKLSYVTVELEKVHRQKDSEFVDILNSIRENKMQQDMLKMQVNKLSGGMKRRLSIACALLTEPKILILDEPTTALDLYFKDDIMKWLEVFQKEGGVVLMTSHDSTEILSADRCLLMSAGQLQELKKEEISIEKIRAVVGINK